MHYYSIRWERVPHKRQVVRVRVTFLDERGEVTVRDALYEEWIGVCTGNVERVVRDVRNRFPGERFAYRELARTKKILPYFEERLSKNKLDYRSKPFYKLYTTAPHKDVAGMLGRRKVSYHDPDDWLVRVYVDLCTRYDTRSFYYRWYELLEGDGREGLPSLLELLRMVPGRNDPPDWTIAAFDLEAVPLVGNHVPMGHHPSDRVVAVSVCKWNRRRGAQRWLLYLLPPGVDEPLPGYEDGFRTEREMLRRLHELLEDAQVLTGYNVNAYDLPVVFARLFRLGLDDLLVRYRSRNVGSDLVVSYRDKTTLDLYPYFKTFSAYDLPSFKLDDVARVKLRGAGDDDAELRKIPVKATGLWSWYRHPAPPVFEEDAARCHEILKPETVPDASRFGTFRTYLDYCLRDSELVYRLFEREHVLSFLVERANFAALGAVDALHLGNSRYLLELFRTYGTRLGYFVNAKCFEGSDRLEDGKRTLLLGGGDDAPKKGKATATYQGALNYCVPERAYEDVAVMDFASMYPSTLLSANLCYGTCTVLSRDEWLALPRRERFFAVPYRQHSDVDFRRRDDDGKRTKKAGDRFAYPLVDPERDRAVIVVNREERAAFLPAVVAHFIEERRRHQAEWKRTEDVYHYNVQLGIKILINSLYGVMANRDSPLAYLVVAVAVVTLSRYQLLGCHRYLTDAGYEVCYVDTDSLMVHRWPADDCDEVNAFLSTLPHVELKFEQRMRRLLVLSKKRYVYQREADGVLVTKGFQKKVNGLVEFMTDRVLTNVWRAIFGDETGERDFAGCDAKSRGWIVWAEILLEANYRCRDPKRYAIYRRVKKLEEYVSASCPAVKYLKKYPDRTDEHVEFTYGRADVAAVEASNWVVDVEDCKWVNYEQLFVGQKKIFVTLLNMAFWHLPDPVAHADAVLNALRWKRFVQAELLHWHATERRIVMLVEPGVKYTFAINNHLTREKRVGRKRKEIGEETRITMACFKLMLDEDVVFCAISNKDRQCYFSVEDLKQFREIPSEVQGHHLKDIVVNCNLPRDVRMLSRNTLLTLLPKEEKMYAFLQDGYVKSHRHLGEDYVIQCNAYEGEPFTTWLQKYREKHGLE